MKALFAGALAAALIVAGPAQAQETLALFEHTCMSAPDGAGALQAAREQGFVRPPPGMADSLSRGDISEPAIVWRMYDGLMLAVMTGFLKDDELPQMALEMCAVMLVPGDAGTEAALERRLGLGKFETFGDQKGVAYEVEGGQRRRVDMAVVFAPGEIRRGRRLRMVFAGEFKTDMGAASILAQISPRPR